MKEFKEFISRGNVMDMAVGIIIGGAFTAIVTSLVEDIITPIIGMIGGFDFSSFVVTVNNSNIAVGNFINAVINFLLIAFVLFSIIKAMNKAASVVKKPEEEAEEAPTTKMCPYCKSEIAIEATRCPHCTSQL
jgi:large conductance mechanosensitive channel